LIASGSHDESLHLWDSRSAKSVRVIAAHSEPITGVQFAADGQLGSSSFDCSCRIWDVGSGQMLASLPKFDRDPVIREQNENHPMFVFSLSRLLE
jgi:COMPASS component SWD3